MSCWSLVSFYFSGLRATWLPIQHVAPSACQATRRPACPWLACGGRHGPRRSTAHRGVTRQPWQPDDTRFLCIVSFYQSSVFHLFETRHSDAECQACWPSSVEREVLRVKSGLMKPSCPSPADSSGIPNGSGKASLLQCVSANVKTNVTWYPSMPFVVAITAVDNAWCFVLAVSFSVALTKQYLLAAEPLQPGRCTCPTLPAALGYFLLLVILSLWI